MHPFIFKDKNGTAAGVVSVSGLGFETNVLDINLSPYTYVCQYHASMTGTITIKSNFNITYTNTAGISDASFNLYIDVFKESILKWDNVINGVKAAELSTNFKLDISMNIAVLADTTLGGATDDTYYGTNTFPQPYVHGSSFYIKKGRITINSTKIQNLYTTTMPSGKLKLYYVTLHEIGHLLGIGNLWRIDREFQATAFLGTFPDGTRYYTGVNALNEYKTYFNNPNFIGMPIEDNGGAGTANSHPEEGAEGSLSLNNRTHGGIFYPGLDHELMTGWIESSNVDNPLSRITIALLDDLGFVVDYTKADIYLYTTDKSYNAVINTATTIVLNYEAIAPTGSTIEYAIKNYNMDNLTYSSAPFTPDVNYFGFNPNFDVNKVRLRYTPTTTGTFTLEYFIKCTLNSATISTNISAVTVTVT
jgi:hypothetical protein